MRQNDPRFSELLQRYLNGTCPPDDEKAVEAWFDSLGSQRAPFPLDRDEADTLEHKLWEKIRRRSSGYRPGVWYRNWMIYIPGTAAALLILAGVLVSRSPEKGPARTGLQELTVRKNTGSKPVPAIYRQPAIREKTNNSSRTILVVLEDESMVWLRPSGSIRYADFSGSLRREVTLRGEAYFEVAEKHEKPFLVRTGNVVTRVTGTKFNVRAYPEDGTVEVEVTEGSVEVSRKDKEVDALAENRQNMKLGARQRAVYHTGSRKLEKLTAVSNRLRPVEEISEELTFEFSDTPLRKVINLLEQAYPVSIRLENQALESCPLTASLSNETLNDKLELICTSIGATFISAPGKITITGNGCAP